jgi:hypothetical protein
MRCEGEGGDARVSRSGHDPTERAFAPAAPQLSEDAGSSDHQKSALLAKIGSRSKLDAECPFGFSILPTNGCAHAWHPPEPGASYLLSGMRSLVGDRDRVSGACSQITARPRASMSHAAAGTANLPFASAPGVHS